MAAMLTALIPIFALMLLGFLLRQRQWLARGFWLPCEQLNYFYLFPALMFGQVARADIAHFPVGPIAGALLGAVAAGALLLWLWRGWRRQPGPVFSSVIQGALRPNTYVAAAAASALFGGVGMTLTSICIAVAIPLLNVASIIVLMHYGRGGAPSAAQLWRALTRNPVIVAVLLGASCNLAGLSLPAVLDRLLTIMGSASLPLGLLSVGAGLDVRAMRGAPWPLLQSSLVKLLLTPLLTLWLGAALGLPGPALITIVLFNAQPCTPSAYIMAKLLGGDARLAAGIITTQTLLAALTLPLVLLAAHRLA